MTIRTALAAAAAVTLLADVPAPAQIALRECEPLTQPTPRTRPLNRRERADSVRSAVLRQVRDTLKADVVQAARHSGISQPEGLVVMQVRGGQPERTEVHLWRANVPDSLVRGVLASRGPLLATLPDRETTLHFRLDQVPWSGTVGDTTMQCPPRLMDPRQFITEINRAVQQQRPLPASSNPEVSVHVRMLVSRDGDVVFAELTRRGHLSRVDAAILEGVRRLRFIPAEVRGVPVDVWAEQPVVVQVPLEPRTRSRTRPGIF